MTKNITLLILIFIISSCSAQENFRDYYYQIGTKKEIKVYKYVDKNNPRNIEYWKVTTNPKTNKILTESFTTDFRLYNIFEEELKTNGAEIIRYADFEVNDEKQNIRIDGTIVDKDVYKWNDTNKYIYSVKYTSPKYGNEQFIKERTKNSFEKITISGTEYSTLKFKDEYEIKSLENDQNYEFHQFTYYAKGIGMVKYQRYHPDGATIELELTEILTEKEFDELKEKASR
ncbi:hypothetical protein [Kordia sp.]|uniref:hypothetical protein n=1 Tax=Kordia sp. TaxID=1965332 RepID=UPI003D2A52D8